MYVYSKKIEHHRGASHNKIEMAARFCLANEAEQASVFVVCLALATHPGHSILFWPI